MNPSLGTHDIDLTRLLESRLLVQANSGGGKSHLLRRLLEQTAGSVQQLIIDTEGEFSSLREKFDYIICGAHGPDAVANPQTAAALARALWESGTSAILDIYDLKAHERTLFVRRFLEALVAAPKKLWHPTLVAIDEIHLYAPQVGSAESSGSVIDLATRGRKRGLCLVGATQRLSKLHKDVAAELQNKLVGRTGLDVDVARAGDELGMAKREAWAALRNLEPGEFYAYGPALSPTVILIKVGPVVTTHPKSGGRLLAAPPPPSKTILRKLGEIEGLQRDAESEAKDLEGLKAEVASLKRQIAAKPRAGISEEEVQRRIRAALQEQKDIDRAELAAAVESIRDHASTLLRQNPKGKQARPAARAPLEARIPAAARHVPAPAPRQVTSGPASVEGLRSGAVRILQELAARAPAGYSRAQVGALTQFSHKGGTFTTYLGDLRRGGFIEERSGLVYATEHGIASLGPDLPRAPTSHAEVMQLWRKALRAGAFSMLEAIVQAGRTGVHRDLIADVVGMAASGGTFTTYLGDLRRNGLITERNKVCTANDILFPESP